MRGLFLAGTILFLGGILTIVLFNSSFSNGLIAGLLLGASFVAFAVYVGHR